jgi:SET domain-containing protein
MFAKKKPLTLYRHPGLYLEQLHGKGRGVFCLEDLKQGDTLEVAPILIFPAKDAAMLLRTLARDYVFSASSFDEKFLKAIGIDEPKNTLCLPLGMTSLCNHMIEPNACYKFDVDDLSAFATLAAARDIQKGEEISLNYGPVWFGVRRLASGIQ